jgi:hypothetical protein
MEVPRVALLVMVLSPARKYTLIEHFRGGDEFSRARSYRGRRKPVQWSDSGANVIRLDNRGRENRSAYLFII